MSERLNSVDIEDVLSSIRRLVSDEQRPAARAAAASPAADPAPSAPVSQVPAPDSAGDTAGDTASESRPEPEAAPQAAPGPAAQPQTAAVPMPGPAEDPLQGDKLILTPALRIAPGAEGEGPASPDAAEAPAEPAPAFHSIRHGAGAARVEAVMDQVARGLEESDWEATSEPPAEFASDWSAAEAAPETPAATVAADPAPADAAPADPVVLADPVAAPVAESVLAAPAADAGLLHEISPVTSDVETDEAADAWPTEDWAAPGEPDMVAPDNGGEDPGWADIAPVSIDRMSASAQSEEPAMPIETVEEEATDAPEWARMEQEARDQGQDEAMPDPLAEDNRARAGGMAAAAAAGAAQAAQGAARDAGWADAAEAQIRRELEDQAESSVFARFEDDDHDDRAFDEEMLRDLVRDIIREELQGALGERITRNVRKLVRSEIARALAVRDFE